MVTDLQVSLFMFKYPLNIIIINNDEKRNISSNIQQDNEAATVEHPVFQDRLRLM